MKIHNLPLRLFSLLILLALVACGGSNEVPPTQDVAQVYTQAAQTVAAQFTQTAAAQPTITSSPTQEAPAQTLVVDATATGVSTLGASPIPQVTGSPTLLFPPLPTQTGRPCNDSLYIGDVGVPDGSTLKVGQTFQKGWILQNTGYCDWGLGYSLQRVGGNTTFDTIPYVIRNLNQVVFAGQWAEITLNMTAPKTPGTYEARFQMYSDKSIPFGMAVTIAVVVKR
ncbi:MAG: NBR1-Ig-like domain-containing protein [Chloroflexota bacterium]